jgi:crotonobetaine/carnitine-CoA ligase
MTNLAVLANRIKDWVTKDPERDVLTFVTIGNNGEFIEEIRTYQQLWDNAQKIAYWLDKQGMKKGDAFGLLMANHPEFVELMIASTIIGTIFVPIDPRTKGDKLRYMIEFADCKGVVAANNTLDNVKAEFNTDDIWLASLTIDPSVDYSLDAILAKELPSPLLEVVSTDIDAPMEVLYTSGTTGDPKAIISSHRRWGDVSQIAPVLGLTVDDRPYTGLSLTHANAQLITLGNTLTYGMRGVISRRFTKSRLWDITRHYGCTFFNLLGGMTTAIYSELPKDNDRDNPVKKILSAGMPEAIWESFSKRFDVELFEFYGAAEGGLTFNPPGEGPVGSCGKSLSTATMKIFNEQGDECATGEAGEICFRNADGSAPIVRYYKNPEASIKKTQGGWLRMGDIGHVDQDGWLFFHHRIGGGIRRNGDFINVASVEKLLSESNEVDDVFVYGVPAANGAPGEKDLVAAVVPKNSSTFDAQVIFSICRQTLESNSVPSYIHKVSEIPKTASEKPQERFLAEAFDTKSSCIFVEKCSN